MPFEIIHIGKSWVVRNQDTKRVLGRHPGNEKGRKKALRQLAAIQIAYEKEKER